MKKLEEVDINSMKENVIESITVVSDNDSKFYKKPEIVGYSFDNKRTVFLDTESNKPIIVHNDGYGIYFDRSTETSIASLNMIFNHFSKQLGEDDLLHSYLRQLLTDATSAFKYQDLQFEKNAKLGKLRVAIKDLKKLVMCSNSLEEKIASTKAIIQDFQLGFIDSNLNVLHNSELIEITWFLKNLEEYKANLSSDSDLHSETNLIDFIHLLQLNLMPVHTSDGFYHTTFSNLEDFIKRALEVNYYENYDAQNHLVESLFDFLDNNGFFDFETLSCPAASVSYVSKQWQLVINSIQKEFSSQNITNYEEDEIFLCDFFDRLLGDYFNYRFTNAPFEYEGKVFTEPKVFIQHFTSLKSVPEFDAFVLAFSDYLDEIKVCKYANNKRVFGLTYTPWQEIINLLLVSKLLGTNTTFLAYEHHPDFKANDLPSEPFTTISNTENIANVIVELEKLLV